MNRDDFPQDDALDLDEIRRLIDMEPHEAVAHAEHNIELITDSADSSQTHRVEIEKPQENTEPGDKQDPRRSLLLYLHDLSYLLTVVVLVFLLCFRIVVVSGDSMYSTLVDGDYLLLMSNVLYNDPQQGDIIVASKDSYENGTPIIKRVIATEGQTVDIDFRRGIVYVDGVALEEDYIYTLTNLDEGVEFPLVVDEGCVFVLGDNRNISKDSRNPEIGLIDTRQIVGKAIVLFFPGTDNGIRHFDRIGVFF